MTNDDLEKKIAEIIDGSVDDWATRDRRGRIQVHVSTIADILVKAGLKFDAAISHTATFDMLQQDRINELEKRIVEAEHRAARAERALRDELVQKTIRLGVTDICPWYIQALNEAEKELAEERKDD